MLASPLLKEDSLPTVQCAGKIAPSLADVPETMLWALHNRASEARRGDGILADPDSIRIHDSIDYDFTGQFGEPAGSLAMRAAAIDRALRHWLCDHPDGFVVSLGEGLETQALRVDNGRMQWLSVDLPDAIRLRERFLPPTDRFRHMAVSALDLAWMDAVDPSSGVFIVAQGLLMYLDPGSVGQLFAAVARRFPDADMVFDTIPPWFSQLTLVGLQQTPRYRLPPMPWGISRRAIAPALRGWGPALGEVAFLDYGMPRGVPQLVGQMIERIPAMRHEIPSLAHVMGAKRLATRLSATVLPRIAKTASMNIIDGIVGADPMNSIVSETASAGTLGSVMEAARRSADVTKDLTVAAGQVVARRMALGMASGLNPSQSDRAEFARMVPEKVEAFSAANRIMLSQSSLLAQEMTRLASEEVHASARATLAMASCTSPMALATAHGRFMLDWFNRATANFVALGMMSIGAQDAAMAPLVQQVAVNVARLTP